MNLPTTDVGVLRLLLRAPCTLGALLPLKFPEVAEVESKRETSPIGHWLSQGLLSREPKAEARDQSRDGEEPPSCHPW